MIRVIVVDDHPVVREGLVAILRDESDFEVVGSVSSAEELFELVPRAHPDVVLLDLELPRADGIEAIDRLSKTAPEARVIVFTAYDTDEKVNDAVRAGARGYLLKGAPSREITKAVRDVHAGGSALEPRVAAKLLSHVSGRAPASVLSPREREVLRLVSDGRSNREIAAKLAIAERTVKYHVGSILNKLGADNRAQAVALASRRKLI